MNECHIPIQEEAMNHSDVANRRAEFDGEMWIAFVQPPGKYPEQSVRLTIDQYNRRLY
jgi:hypothetical protein